MPDNNPLGTRKDLAPSFWTQVFALLKKQSLIKYRTISYIIEVVVSILLLFCCLPAYYSGQIHYPNNPDPPRSQDNTSLLLEWCQNQHNSSILYFYPNTEKMHQFVGNTTLLKACVYGGKIPDSDIIFPGVTTIYTNDYSSLRSDIFKCRGHCMALEWVNINHDINSYLNPFFRIFLSSLKQMSYVALTDQIQISILNMKKDLFDLESSYNDHYLNAQIYTNPFAHPESNQRSMAFSFAFGIIAAISLLVAILPDFEIFFREKEKGIMALSFHMGLKQSSFWFSYFIAIFGKLFILYVYLSLVLTYWVGLNGTDFGVVLFSSFLYILSMMSCIAFLSTFMPTVSRGRALIISLFIMNLIYGVGIQFLSFQSRSFLTLLLCHLLCIFPGGAYELFIIEGAVVSSNKYPPISWKNLNSRSYPCPLWIPLMWEAISIVLYLILFFICNSYIHPPFGAFLTKRFKLFKNKKRQEVNTSMDNNEIETNTNSDSNDIVIQVQHLSKLYKKKKNEDEYAIDDISFNVYKGEKIIIIGPSLAGKSTLIQLLAGCRRPTDGDIIIKHHDISNCDIHNIGVCFENNVLINKLNVDEHFNFFGACCGLSQTVLESSKSYLYDIMELDEIRNTRSIDLSGGQKRKLCLALAFLGNPQLVLLDNPTAGVDIQARQKIFKMITQFPDTTMLLTNHVLEEAEVISSRLVIMADGKIAYSGSATELRQKYKCGYVLTVERDDGALEPILEFIQSFIPEADVDDDRENTFRIPIDRAIPKFLSAFNEKLRNFGVRSYSFSEEKLEDTLLRFMDKEGYY